MDDGLGKIKVIPDHFQVSTPSGDSPQSRSSPGSQPSVDNSLRSSRSRQKFKSAAAMLNLLSLRGLPWSSGADGQEKVHLTAAELESLRSELAEIEEREAHFKARLEHIDEILRSARLSGYLYIRTRWTALPGEPAPIDDTDVDDWLPRFVVLHGQCIFFYLSSTGNLIFIVFSFFFYYHHYKLHPDSEVHAAWLVQNGNNTKFLSGVKELISISR
ncbi:hypothetical protein PTKIN_Ptkin05aG0071000 [Pterospermum kingtungense]